jgi:hypothetical protein
LGRDPAVPQGRLQAGAFAPGLFEAVHVRLDSHHPSQVEQRHVIGDLASECDRDRIGVRERRRALVELTAAVP